MIGGKRARFNSQDPLFLLVGETPPKEEKQNPSVLKYAKIY